MSIKCRKLCTAAPLWGSWGWIQVDWIYIFIILLNSSSQYYLGNLMFIVCDDERATDTWVRTSKYQHQRVMRGGEKHRDVLCAHWPCPLRHTRLLWFSPNTNSTTLETHNRTYDCNLISLNQTLYLSWFYYHCMGSLTWLKLASFWTTGGIAIVIYVCPWKHGKNLIPYHLIRQMRAVFHGKIYNVKTLLLRCDNPVPGSACDSINLRKFCKQILNYARQLTHSQNPQILNNLRQPESWKSPKPPCKILTVRMKSTQTWQKNEYCDPLHTVCGWIYGGIFFRRFSWRQIAE